MASLSPSPSMFRNPFDPGEQGVDTGKVMKLAEDVIGNSFKTKFPVKILSLNRADEQFGNISLVHRAELLWNDADKNARSDLPDFVVLKLPTATKLRAEMSRFMDKKELDQMTDEHSVIEKGHNAECNAYDLLETIDGLKVPKHYGHSYVKQPGNYDGMIVLEDLTQNTDVPDFIEGLNIDQIYEAVDNLAILHSYSLLSDHWRSKLGKIHNLEIIDRYMKVGEKVCKYLGTMYSSIFAFNDADLSPLFNPNRYKFMTTDEGNAHPVMMHGDFWTYNLLFRLDPATGKTTNELVAILDWQSVHSGTIGEDLARLLAISATTEIRRGSLKKIISRYYMTLQARMIEKDALVPFSMQDLKQSYMQAFPYMSTPMAYTSVMQLDGALSGRSEEEKRALVQRVADVISDAIAILKAPDRQLSSQ